jgi:hypothetical protein
MIAITYNGSHVSEYVNGVRVYDANTAETSMYKTTTNAYFGASFVNGFHAGSIDNVLVYNRSLTDSEIQSIYYDNLQDVRFRTNSNSTFSNNISGSGVVDVPYDLGDDNITALIADLPSTQTINGVTVRNYTSTASPFNLTSTIKPAELKFTKTGTVYYSVSNEFPLDQNYDPSTISSLTASVTPSYTKASPYSIPQDGLYAYWKFDEANGTKVTDFSGNGHNSTVVVGMNWSDGKYNTAGNFNGTSSRVAVSTADMPNEKLTFCGWVYPTVKSRDIFTRWEGPGFRSFAISTAGLSNRLALTLSQDGTNSSSYVAPATSGIPLNSWTMIAITYNGSHVSEYVNGVRVYDANTAETSMYKTTTNAYFGASFVNGFHAGSIDNVLVYNRSLTDSEIQSIYYDNLQDVRFRTNSNSTFSNNISGSGVVDVPYDLGDDNITALIADLPSTQTINGVTVRNYTSTASPFNLTSTISTAEKPAEDPA